MATKPLTLKGLADVEDEDDGLQRKWRLEKQQLEAEARALRTELGEATAERDKLRASVGILRRQLSPLHHALRAVFGEIEIAIGDEDVQPNAPSQAASRSNTSVDPRWESYKNNFPGAAAKIIDVLLAHPQLSITQIAELLRMHYNTAKDALLKLKKAGAVASNGGIYQLNR